MNSIDYVFADNNDPPPRIVTPYGDDLSHEKISSVREQIPQDFSAMLLLGQPFNMLRRISTEEEVKPQQDEVIEAHRPEPSLVKKSSARTIAQVIAAIIVVALFVLVPVGIHQHWLNDPNDLT